MCIFSGIMQRRSLWTWILKVLKCSNESADAKMGSFVYFIMSSPRVMIIKISKLAHVLYFLLLTAKNYSQFEQRSHLALEIPFMRYLEKKYQKNYRVNKIIPKYRSFKEWYLANGSLELINQLTILPKLWLIFFCY